MSMNNNYCVIMAGGAGKRFWPMSRVDHPKQFMPLCSSRVTFLQHTYDCFKGAVPEENILVVTTARYAHFVKEQLPEMPEENIIVEPYGRDTAPCAIYATYKILKRNPEATVVFTPADHRTDDVDSFRYSILKSLDYASRKDVLLQLGTRPTRPDTNFGYIQIAGGKKDLKATDEPVRVKSFSEKPDISLAKVFLSSGEFYWNAGLFACKAEIFRKEFEKCLPLTASQFEGWADKLDTPAEGAFIDKVYGGCEKTSIAYGIMEKTGNAWMLPAEFEWLDAGEWESYYDALPKNEDGNVLRGGDVITDRCSNTLVVSQHPGKLIAVEGLSDYMVIETDDVLLICPKDSKRYVESVRTSGIKGIEKYQ